MNRDPQHLSLIGAHVQKIRNLVDLGSFDWLAFAVRYERRELTMVPATVVQPSKNSWHVVRITFIILAADDAYNPLSLSETPLPITVAIDLRTGQLTGGESCFITFPCLHQNGLNQLLDSLLLTIASPHSHSLAPPTPQPRNQLHLQAVLELSLKPLFHVEP